MTLYCIECGCNEEEGKTEKCITGKSQHSFRSTEGRHGLFRKQRETAGV